MLSFTGVKIFSKMNPGHWQSPFPQGSSAPRAKPAAQPLAVALGGYTETLPARKSELCHTAPHSFKHSTCQGLFPASPAWYRRPRCSLSST